MNDTVGDFSLHSVIKQNLDALSVSLEREAELRLCEWASVAEAAADCYCSWLDDGLDTTEAIAALASALNDAHPTFGLGETACLSFPRAYERASFCRILLELLSQRDHPLTEADFLPSEALLPAVAYVKNPYADEAYDVFAEQIPELTVRYVSSFDEGVRLLLTGEIGYCLLPFEESGGLRLSTVERLLHRHDLRISRVTPVFGPDGAAELRYALVSQSASPVTHSAEDDRYLELRLPLSGECTLSDICVVCELLSLSLYRVQTVSFGEGEERDSYLSAVLFGTGADFTVVLLYLAIFCHDATVVGLYRNLES